MFGHKSFLRIGALDDLSISGLYKSSYELERCHFCFSQGVDRNGNVQTEVQGGTIHLILAGIPSDEILHWMLKSHKFEDGAIVICDSNDVPLEKILFSHAACIAMETNYIQKGRSYINTQLTIQAESIKVGNIDLENRWIY